ncbi:MULTISPECIES: ABC transporter permease [Pontibacillus]|uniref:ABC transporter permease n=1 Tax=Pontibacillus chungwhensis TaxID=265426 RepID=A0ABY8V296_9BACI|nr:MULTISPECIES: ABC transporter permease [Pontibacillus]MCD5324950.1 ABC transporter permease [Pontibacillus sp. HN14]WIF98909.1 ABC transporter permease [Pontibacillus chungwhensis]
MNKFWIVLGHTYLSRLKSKTFLITTGIILLLIFALTNFQNVMDSFDDGESKAPKIAVVDEEGSFFKDLEEQVNAQQAELELESFQGEAEEAKQAVQDGEYQGVLMLQTSEGIPTGTYYTEQIAESSISGRLQQALQQVKVSVATEQAGIDQQTVNGIFAPVSFEKVALDKKAKTQEELSEARGLVYVMLFLLYIGVIMYGNMIAQEVAQEKSSRVMEILISSVSPVTQMFGKIIGIALLGITQFGLILLVGVQSVSRNMDQLEGGIFTYFGLGDANATTLVYAVIFFLLGYLLYATLAAMLGSLVSRTEDAQQVVTPMILLIVAAFMIAMYGLNAPETTLVTVTSFIPFFAPMLMFLRVGMLDVPLWEVGVSIGLLIGTILLLAVIGGRIYRGGVLMYGKGNVVKSFKRAFQLSKKES